MDIPKPTGNRRWRSPWVSERRRLSARCTGAPPGGGGGQFQSLGQKSHFKHVFTARCASKCMANPTGTPNLTSPRARSARSAPPSRARQAAPMASASEEARREISSRKKSMQRVRKKAVHFINGVQPCAWKCAYALHPACSCKDHACVFARESIVIRTPK